MKKFFLIIMFLGVAMVSSAWATTLTGSITGGNGLVGTDGWSDATLSWTIFDNVNTGVWTYIYTFDTNSVKDLSHIIIEVSDTFTEKDVITSSPLNFELGTYSEGGSNPQMPGEVFGLKWDGWEEGIDHAASDPYYFDSDDDDTDEYRIMLTTLRDPVQGNFYAKDGRDANGTIDVLAYNTGFSNPENGAFVWVPDSTGGGGGGDPIPEPATFMLFGIGLLGLARVSRRKK